MDKKYVEIDQTDIKVGDTIYVVDPDFRLLMRTADFKVTSLYDDGYMVGVEELGGEEIDLGCMEVYRLEESHV